MNYWWVKLYIQGTTAQTSGCVTADDIGAAVDIVRMKFRNPAINEISVLPYPADPRWDVGMEKPSLDGPVCPSFCYEPESCKGQTSCPKRPSCVE